MKELLIGLHVLDAALGLALIFLDGFLSGEVPVSWLTVIILDGIVVLLLVGDMSAYRCAYASRVVWVGLCYLLETLTKGLDDQVLVCGGAALLVYSFALSVTLLCTKSPERKPSELREVVVVTENSKTDKTLES